MLLLVSCTRNECLKAASAQLPPSRWPTRIRIYQELLSASLRVNSHNPSSRLLQRPKMRSMTVTGRKKYVAGWKKFRRNAPCYGLSWALVERRDGDGRWRGTESAFWTFGLAWLHDSLRYHRASPLQVETQRSNGTARRGTDKGHLGDPIPLQ